MKDNAADYKSYVGKKAGVIIVGIILCVVLFLITISVGAIRIPIPDVIATIFHGPSGTELFDRALWNIRIPQALTAVVAGAGLAIAGVAMQSVLHNPLASPFTLGLSNAAAFGAAVGILIFGAGTTGSSIADAVVVNNPYLTTVSAFVFSLATTAIILAIAKIRGATPETMVLAGVAISSLFSAGLMAIQYFVDDTRLASIVFWQFGDVSRASWSELGLITAVVAVCSLYLFFKRLGLQCNRCRRRDGKRAWRQRQPYPSAWHDCCIAYQCDCCRLPRHHRLCWLSLSAYDAQNCRR